MENWGNHYKKNSNLDELVNYLYHFKLKEVLEIPGFDPSDLFTTHMYAVGYKSSFVKTTLFKEGGGDNKKPRESILEKVHGYIDTLVITKYQYIQNYWTTRSGNPNPDSSNGSQRISSAKVMQFHEATIEALKYSIDEIKQEKRVLKEKTK